MKKFIAFLFAFLIAAAITAPPARAGAARWTAKKGFHAAKAGVKAATFPARHPKKTASAIF